MIPVATFTAATLTVAVLWPNGWTYAALGLSVVLLVMARCRRAS